jgi:hypothetical protein
VIPVTFLEISKFLRWGYENEIPILYENAFLHFSSHIFLRSAIIDMCALFDNHKYQAYNFYKLINTKKKLIKELDAESIENIKVELEKASTIFPPIKLARDKEIAHYRFEESSINLSHDLLPALVSLYDIAAEIHDIAMWGQKNDETRKWFSIAVKFDDGASQNYLISLQRLLKKTNQIDYKKLWDDYLKKLK